MQRVTSPSPFLRFVLGVSDAAIQGVGNRTLFDAFAAAFAHLSEITMEQSPAFIQTQAQSLSVKDSLSALATISMLLRRAFRNYALIDPDTISLVNTLIVHIAPVLQKHSGDSWRQNLGLILEISLEKENSVEQSEVTNVLLAHEIAYGDAAFEDKFTYFLRITEPGWAGIAASALVNNPLFSKMQLTPNQKAHLFDALLRGMLKAGTLSYDLQKAFTQWVGEHHKHPSVQTRLHAVAEAVDSLHHPYAYRLGRLLSEKDAQDMVTQLGEVMNNAGNVIRLYQGAHLSVPLRYSLPWERTIRQIDSPFFYAAAAAFNLRAHLADVTYVKGMNVQTYDRIIERAMANNDSRAMDAALFAFALVAMHQLLPDVKARHSKALCKLIQRCGLSERDAQALLQVYDVYDQPSATHIGDQANNVSRWQSL